MRQHQPQRVHQVRREVQQKLPLHQAFVHQAKGEMLEIAQSAVDQLGRGRGGRRRQVALLDQQHRKPAAGGVTRDAAAMDAAADYRDVVFRHGFPGRSFEHAWAT